MYRANVNPLQPEDVDAMLTEITTDAQRAAFEKNLELDFAYSISGLGRFRVNVFRQRGTTALAIRSIRIQTPTFGELNLPAVILDIAMKRRGLILVTGTTGSGKSTLLASMIDHINNNSSVNIITVEDPIEFLYKNNKSIIAQREIGQDTQRFAQALRASFRQDPDVILIGEIRDKDTMETGISADGYGTSRHEHAAYHECAGNDLPNHVLFSAAPSSTNPPCSVERIGRDHFPAAHSP